MVHVMRYIIEQHQASPHRIFEVEHIQAGGGLVQTVTVAAPVETEHAADQQAQGGFVRDDQHVFVTVLYHKIADDGQSAGNNAHAIIAALRCKGVRVFFPGNVFVWEFSLNISPAYLFPVTVISRSASRVMGVRPGGLARMIAGLVLFRFVFMGYFFRMPWLQIENPHRDVFFILTVF